MLAHELKLALKVLRRRRFFTFISLFGIGFTLVVLIVVSALLDHAFAAHPPERRGNRMLFVFDLVMTGPHSTANAPAGYGFLDRNVRTLPGVEAVSLASVPHSAQSYPDGRKVRSAVRSTDGAFWRVLDFDFLEGGPFTDEDDAAGRRVAVINEATRDAFFGGAPALGRTVDLDGVDYRVVGVVRDVPLLRRASYADIWTPNGAVLTEAERHEVQGGFGAIILAKDRRDFPAIKAELADRMKRVALPDPKHFDTLSGGAETFFENVSRTLVSERHRQAQPGRLLLLIVVMALAFMLLPALNLVNINLSRMLERAPEIGVRKAFGASSARLVRQFVVENLVLTAIGGAIGLAAGALVLGAINRSGLIAYARLDVNWRVFGYGLVLTVVFALLSGCYPAWRMSRLDPAAALAGRSL